MNDNPTESTASTSLHSSQETIARPELHHHLSQDLCLMLADVVGSTSFYQKYGDVQGRLFVQRHHDLLSPLVAHYRGNVIKTIGDAVMASFDAPEQALDCAVSMQQKLREANQQNTGEAPLRTKISLHYGSALVETNDIYGDLVNMSARLNNLVEPDQILISEAVYDCVKEHTSLPLLPLEPVRWKEGEKGLTVYEVLWQQTAGATREVLVFRNFGGANSSCFYCGLREHQATDCPSKQLNRCTDRLNRLGYLPLSEILKLFQQEDLSTTAPTDPRDAPIFDAFYEICLPYQLRFLLRVWLATNEDWRQVERLQVRTSPMAGTRLWMGFDCLRVSRLDDAQPLLLAALESNPDDYKPYVALGFWAMEKAEPFSALQHWRRALSLTHNHLQKAYLHLLMYRLYDVGGKTDLARQELQRALSQDAYLHEAKYRRITLLVKADQGDDVLSQLQKFIQDDRTTYIKVLLDPAFAPLRVRLIPLVTALLTEARSTAIDQIRHVSEDLSRFRDWYPQPEAELLTVEKAVDRLRRHFKSRSYFGYCDVAYEGEILRQRIKKLMARRKTQLRHEFTVMLGTVRQSLSTLAASPPFSANRQEAARLAKYQRDMVRLQNARGLHESHRFWRAWKELHALKTQLDRLHAAGAHGGIFGRLANRRLRYLLLFGLGGGGMVTTMLFGVIGYLTFFSRLRLSEPQLFLLLILGALGGSIIGSGVGWLTHWYRSRS